LRQARALAQVQQARLGPSVGSSASAQRSRTEAGTGNSFRAGLDASWESDLFGGQQAARDAAERDAQAAAATLGDVRVSLAAEVALAYIELRSSEQRLVIARDNLASQQEITTLPAGTGRELLFTPDGHRMVAEDEGGIRIWNARTWEPVCWLDPPNKTRCWWLRIPRDGSLVASVRGTEVRLWDLNNLKPAERPLLGRTASEIHSLAFSPDGKNVAAGTYDGGILIWNVAGRQEVGSFKLHRSIIKNLNFSPDGRSLISQSYDHTVRQWTVP
jgi:WD40 repeat protein